MGNSFTSTASSTSPTVTYVPPGTFDTTVASIADVSGFYASEQDLVDLFGAANVYAWSSLDGMGTRNPSRILRALLWADAEIDARFIGYRFRLDPHLTLTTDTAINTAGKWGSYLAVSDLYNTRGQRDDGDNKPTNQYDAAVRDVYREMALVRAGVLRLDATLADNMGSTGPTAICYGW